jgi:hypothetical protein
MARRKTSTGIALPWENRGTTIRRVLAGSRSRTVLAVVAIVGGVFVTYHRSEERRVARITRQTSVEVEQAVVRFREEIGRCPRSLDELLHPPRAGARYLRVPPVDGNGNPLVVRCPAADDPDSVEVAASAPLDSENP